MPIMGFMPALKGAWDRVIGSFIGMSQIVQDLRARHAQLEADVAGSAEQLRDKTQDLHALLQHTPQGVLTITAGGLIHPDYAACLEQVFECGGLAGKTFAELVLKNACLGADARAQLDEAVSSCMGQDMAVFKAHASLMPHQLDIVMPDGRIKALALGWIPRCQADGVVDKLMLFVRDVTRLKDLLKLSNEQKRELDIIAEIQSVTQERFSDFIDRATRLLDVNRVILASVQGRGLDMVHVLYRNMHTIKAGARTHGLLNLINLVREAELAYDDLLKQGDTHWQAEALLRQLDGVKAMVDTYARINEQVLGRKGPGRRGSVERYVMVERDQVVSSLHMLAAVDANDVVAMRAAISQIGLTLNLIGTERLDDVLAGAIDALPTLARELGKEPPMVFINDQQIVVRKQISPLLKNLFTHLLHNALDHGLETANERLALGKSAAGKITIDMALDENKLWINLRDDGRGLPIGRIRSRALAQNLLSMDDVGSPQLVAQTIFHAGLSTADRVTDVSGRGVGMDAVKGFLDKEGGNIVVHFLDDRHGADYRSFELIIGLPAKFAAIADLKHPFLNKDGWTQQSG